MSYLIDLHVHYKRRIRETQTHLDEACDAAVARGLHGIAFTEHAIQMPHEELVRLRDKYNGDSLVIYTGAEITVEGMDLVLFAPDEKQPIQAGFTSYVDLKGWLHKISGAGFLAHPFRKGREPSKSWMDDPLNGIELRSRNTPLIGQWNTMEMAKKHDLLLLCNSDAHRARHVGIYYNFWPECPRDNAELVSFLRCGGSA